MDERKPTKEVCAETAERKYEKHISPLPDGCKDALFNWFGGEARFKKKALVLYADSLDFPMLGQASVILLVHGSVECYRLFTVAGKWQLSCDYEYRLSDLSMTSDALWGDD